MDKQVLIVGSGGREHALVRAFKRSPSVGRVSCAPGNAGIAEEVACYPVAPEDVRRLVDLAKKLRADLVVVGPEGPLVAGLADELVLQDIPVFGPLRQAALIESSKVVGKDIMQAANVPTARFHSTTNFEVAKGYILDSRGRVVIKADGLCAGKGVIVCDRVEDAVQAAQRMLVRNEFGEAGRRILIEERLQGREVSLLALVDGERVVMLPSAEDHKAVFDGDMGPNTGGMGAYSPAAFVDDALVERVRVDIMEPVVREMAARGTPYRGVLFAGLMLVPDRGPVVLEFNCRFGDPETQVILSRFASDPYPWFEGTAQGQLPPGIPFVLPDAAVCVVMCAEGYPAGRVRKQDIIQGVDQAALLEGVTVYHAGTTREDGKLLTNGGRVLGVTATGKHVQAACVRAYEAVQLIHWCGEHHRTDIAQR